LSHHWNFEATCHCWLTMKITMLNLVDIAHSWIFVIVSYKYLGSLSWSWFWNIDTQLSSWKRMCLIWMFSYFTWGELIVLEWIQIVHYKYLGIHVIKYVANYTSSNLPFTSSSRHTHQQVAKSLTLKNYNFTTHYQYVSFLSSLFLCKCSLWLNQPRPKVICVWNTWLFLES